MVYKNVRKVSEEGGSYDIQEDPIELEEQN